MVSQRFVFVRKELELFSDPCYSLTIVLDNCSAPPEAHPEASELIRAKYSLIFLIQPMDQMDQGVLKALNWKVNC